MQTSESGLLHGLQVPTPLPLPLLALALALAPVLVH